MHGRKHTVVLVITSAVLIATLITRVRAADNLKVKVLCDFEGGPEGAFPRSELIVDDKGNLYGTTSGGGSPRESACGTAFRLTPGPQGNWSETILHNFQCDGKDGRGPEGMLVFDKTGNLWGATPGGGTGGQGTIFELTPGPQDTWSESVFSLSISPQGGVTLDAAGNIYGATQYPPTVFEVTPASNGDWRFTTLYEFSLANGVPTGGIILDLAGNIYGVTPGGGALPNGTGDAGTVFELIRGSNGARTEKVLHRFTWGDGARLTGPDPRAAWY